MNQMKLRYCNTSELQKISRAIFNLPASRWWGSGWNLENEMGQTSKNKGQGLPVHTEEDQSKSTTDVLLEFDLSKNSRGKKNSMGIGSLRMMSYPTSMGFEPTRGDPNGLAVHRLNRSATMSSTFQCLHPSGSINDLAVYECHICWSGVLLGIFPVTTPFTGFTAPQPELSRVSD